MLQHTEAEILKFVKIDDLNEEMKYIATFVGLDTVKKMMEILGGSRIAIPKPSTYKQIALLRYLESNSNNLNDIEIKKLSRKFDLHENTCKKIIQNVKN